MNRWTTKRTKKKHSKNKNKNTICDQNGGGGWCAYGRVGGPPPFYRILVFLLFPFLFICHVASGTLFMGKLEKHKALAGTRYEHTRLSWGRREEGSQETAGGRENTREFRGFVKINVRILTRIKNAALTVRILTNYDRDATIGWWKMQTNGSN